MYKKRGKMAGKSKKPGIKKLQINLTNRWLYTLIVFFSLIVIGVFVYATTPNPGHDITQIAPPSVCSADQFLKWTTSGWACEAVSGEVGIGGSGTANYIPKFTAATTVGNSVIYETAGNVGINTTSPTYELDVNGYVNARAFIGDGRGLMNIIVKVTQTNDVCDDSNDGLLRYRSSYCSGDDNRSSSLGICMRTGDSSYAWQILKTSTWIDTSCDIDGCPPGQTYYECRWEAEPGCYYSEPYGCYFPACFLSGTKVLMADGSYKEIQDIQSDNLVASYDLINSAPAVSRVEQLLIHPDTEGGYLIINNKLEVTANHNMWVVNRQLWQQMHFINIGDILLDSDGKEVIIYSIDKIKGTNTVYNLQLEGDYNNYFTEDILIHNVKVNGDFLP